MTSEHQQWQELKLNYLKHVEQALASVDSPKTAEVLNDVAAHLENKYADLPPEYRTWEAFQQIITEMGPPQEYAELLREGKPMAVKNKFGINEFLAVVFVITLMIVGGYLIYTAQKTTPASTPAPFEFEPDEQVLGRWVSVDFVRNIDYFRPGQKQWTGDLYLKGLTFYDDGTTSGPWIWTRNTLWHPGDKTKARYTTQEIEGATYLFMEWMSGDVTIRGQKPRYYVLKRNQSGINAINNSGNKVSQKDTFKNVSLKPGVNANPQNENQSMGRTFYFKLPLAQPEFHWKFTNKDLYLSGKLILRIVSDDQVNEIVVFNKGEITEGWETICSGRGPQDNTIYFGFQSTKKYSTKSSDKVELELIAKEDLYGIGRLQTGVLKAGTYKAQGKLKIYSQLENDDTAYIEWQDKWLLDITSEKGWMTSELGFFIYDNGAMRPLTRAEKKRICAGAGGRNSRFFGYSDISLMEKSVSKNDNENRFRKIRIRKELIRTRIDITEFTDERQEQIQSETTMVWNHYFTQRFEHSQKKVFLENGDLKSGYNIFEFGRIDPEVAIKIRILCYLYDNDNQAELFETATTFNDAADVDRLQLINLKDNSIVCTLELNKMDWELCRKIQWYHKGSNTLSKSVEYADFNRPVEFKTLADPGDSGYLLPYKMVRRYFDNDGNEEKTETLEIVDAAMTSSRKRRDFDTIRQNYETDFDIKIPDDYTIIDKRNQNDLDTEDIK